MWYKGEFAVENQSEELVLINDWDSSFPQSQLRSGVSSPLATKMHACSLGL